MILTTMIRLLAMNGKLKINHRRRQGLKLDNIRVLKIIYSVLSQTTFVVKAHCQD